MSESTAARIASSAPRPQLARSKRTKARRFAEIAGPYPQRQRGARVEQRVDVDVTASALADTDTDPSELDLELTESAIMGDLEWTIVSLGALKGLGLRLSVDDFGTGHSSLSHLKNFPVDTLKIDQSFVKNLGQAPIVSTLLASIVDLAHVLGLSVTAEGVEHEVQLEDLKRLGCDTARGYLLAEPLAPEAVTELLAQRGPHLPPARPAAQAR